MSLWSTQTNSAMTRGELDLSSGRLALVEERVSALEDFLANLTDSLGGQGLEVQPLDTRQGPEGYSAEEGQG